MSIDLVGFSTLLFLVSHGGEGLGLIFIVAAIVAMAATILIFRRLYKAHPSAFLRIIGMTYGASVLIIVGASVAYQGSFILLLVPVAFVGFVVAVPIGAIILLSNSSPKLR